MSVQIKEFTKNLAKSRDLRLSVVFNNKAVETFSFVSAFNMQSYCFIELLVKLWNMTEERHSKCFFCEHSFVSTFCLYSERN